MTHSDRIMPVSDTDAALLRAVMVGDAQEVKNSVTEGADASVKDKNGLTALMWAAGNSDLPITLILLAAGADVNARSEMGRTALMYVAKLGHTGIAEALLDAGADLMVKDENGVTARDLAERHGQAAVVQLLEQRRVQSSG